VVVVVQQEGRDMKRPHKPLPGQLALFQSRDLPPPGNHDPSGMTWQECAAWALKNGTGVLSRFGQRLPVRFRALRRAPLAEKPGPALGATPPCRRARAAELAPMGT
jgi:hypothetical protein